MISSRVASYLLELRGVLYGPYTRSQTFQPITPGPWRVRMTFNSGGPVWYGATVGRCGFAKIQK